MALMNSHENKRSYATRFVALLILVFLTTYWVWVSGAMVEGALDYPVRLAGVSEAYPAKGTFDFYLNCSQEVLWMLMKSSPFWVAPATMCFWLGRKVFPQLQGVRFWCVGFAVIILPSVFIMCSELFYRRGWLLDLIGIW
jgi:hypothetical protein